MPPKVAAPKAAAAAPAEKKAEKKAEEGKAPAADVAAAAGLKPTEDRPVTAGRRAAGAAAADATAPVDAAAPAAAAPAAAAPAAAATAELRYWQVKSRGICPLYVAAVAGKFQTELKWNGDFEFPSPTANFKAFAPFGSLPVLVDDGLLMAESMAIVRYLGRKYGVGECKALYDFGKSEMVIEQCTGIFVKFGDAQYTSKDGKPDRVAAYTALFAEAGPIPTTLGQLEKIVEEGGWFGKDGMTLGDVAFAGMMNLTATLEATVLDKFPKLKAICTKVDALPGVVENLDKMGGPYFTRSDA